MRVQVPQATQKLPYGISVVGTVNGTQTKVALQRTGSSSHGRTWNGFGDAFAFFLAIFFHLSDQPQREAVLRLQA